MCPTNRIGTVDLYLTSHHGLEKSGAPALVHALQPRVAVMNNGTRKGGTPDAFRVLHESPGLEDLWQLHWSYNVEGEIWGQSPNSYEFGDCPQISVPPRDSTAFCNTRSAALRLTSIHFPSPMYRAVLTLTLMLAGLTPASAELPAVGIARFSTVAEGIYRGGQPDEQGFLYLKQRGIKTIVNLRARDDEGNRVRELGMNYVHIPMRLIFPWSKVPDSSIQKFFEVIDNPDNYPIFIHCHRGADRTGALSALYRIRNQGWSSKKAWSEARDIGLHWWFRALKGQVREFITDPIVDDAPARAY